MTPVTIDADALIAKYQQELANTLHRALIAEAALAATQAALAEAEARATLAERAEGEQQG